MHKGKVYEFNVVPFGLKVSSAALIRGLDLALLGLGHYTLNFVDDILIISQSESQHIKHLDQILRRFVYYNFTLNFKKIKLFQEEVEFLGFILSEKGIFPQPGKVDLIQKRPPPHNLKQLRSFIGVLNFYSRFADGYSDTLVPLVKLLKKQCKWTWGKEEQTAYEKIKKLLIKEVCLAHPDTSAAYILRTDSSEFALGASLSQIDKDGHERVIIYISRTLKGPELSYYTSEKELLGVVWALEKLKTYLRAAKVFIKTDHKASVFMYNSSFSGDRLRRWILATQDYNMTLEHVRGKDNAVADLLSRHPNYEPEKMKEPLEVTIAFTKLQKFSDDFLQILKDFARTQQADPRLAPLIRNANANSVHFRTAH